MNTTDEDALIVYTAITGRCRDRLQEIKAPPDLDRRPVRFLCFTDSITEAPAGWELLPLPWEHDDPRRAARYAKVLPHVVLPLGSRYSLWHDGSHNLIANPWDLADKYLNDVTCFATFLHPQRLLVMEEVAACKRLKKDRPQVLDDAYAMMRRYGFPDEPGVSQFDPPLLETSAVLRRHFDQGARDLAEDWWELITTGSVRDQVSLPFALWRCARRPAILPGNRAGSPLFDFRPHR